jgi:amidophosphoribosyltransferase
MCAIVGIFASTAVNQDLYDALIALQHRGQSAAGIMTCDQQQFYLRKAKGLVREVFETRHMLRLQGNMGIGHVRYPTAGSDSEAAAQPFYVNSPYGLGLAHNGNLTNATQLTQHVVLANLRHLNTSSDSEVLLNVLAHELQQLHVSNVHPEMIFKAVTAVHQRCRGAKQCGNGYASWLRHAGIS